MTGRVRFVLGTRARAGAGLARLRHRAAARHARPLGLRRAGRRARGRQRVGFPHSRAHARGAGARTSRRLAASRRRRARPARRPRGRPRRGRRGRPRGRRRTARCATRPRPPRGRRSTRRRARSTPAPRAGSRRRISSRVSGTGPAGAFSSWWLISSHYSHLTHPDGCLIRVVSLRFRLLGDRRPPGGRGPCRRGSRRRGRSAARCRRARRASGRRGRRADHPFAAESSQRPRQVKHTISDQHDDLRAGRRLRVARRARARGRGRARARPRGRATSAPTCTYQIAVAETTQ